MSVHPARHLLRAKDLIDARYRDPLDVAALARAAHVSSAHFSREFKSVFGETPHQYLLTRRLERAAELLRNTDHSVAARTTMLNRLTHAQVWVDDQDEALAFYTEKLGMELREDVTVPEMGNFRWLSVGVPGQDVSITLMAVPGPPVFDDETRKQILDLLAKGASGGLFFATDDIQASYEELKKRGVEFAQEPTEQPYGIDAGFRDPSGNSFRMAQLK